MTHPTDIDRRQLLVGTGTAIVSGLWTRTAASAAQDVFARTVVSIAEFGARTGPLLDNTRAIQAAIHAVERSGGGTVVIPGRFTCGTIVISGANVRLRGRNGWLVNGRLTIRPEASNIEVADLGLLDTRGDRRSFLVDISGRGCRFSNVQLVKDPIAGGVQMYVRHTASGCRFTGLRLKGSNGIILFGRDHLFEDFELESTMSKSVGGDDAFAIKAANGVTENITIRNGTIRGFGAMVAFGSEIGTSKGGGGPGAVRNVAVENVTGDRCTRIAFFKPGGLDYDYRNGLVEHVTFKNVTLSDPSGEYFRTGIYILAGRGAIIRDVKATGIRINARAMDRGVAPTSAIQIYLTDKGAPATIRDVSVQLAFTDPHAGAVHGPGSPGHPVGHIVDIEKANPARGSMSGIILDIEGRGAAIAGIHVGGGLDGAIRVDRAVLSRVATDPPGTAGAAAIWSESRLVLGDVQLQPVKGPKFGGRAFSGLKP